MLGTEASLHFYAEKIYLRIFFCFIVLSPVGTHIVCQLAPIHFFQLSRDLINVQSGCGWIVTAQDNLILFLYSTY